MAAKSKNRKRKIETGNPNRAADEAAGRAAYEAYGESRGWVTWNADLMPSWDDCRTDIKIAWMKAAEAVAQFIRRRAAAALPRCE